MKKLALVLALTLVAGSAFAGWGTNNFGLYFDTGATNNCGYGVGLQTFYLIGTGIETPTVKGFETKLNLTGPITVVGAAFPAPAVNAATREGEYIVGFGDPQPAVGGQILLMTVYGTVAHDFTPVTVDLSQIYFSSVADGDAVGGYLDGADITNIIAAYPAGAYDSPELTINGECSVATEDAAWGQVKSLFR